MIFTSNIKNRVVNFIARKFLNWNTFHIKSHLDTSECRGPLDQRGEQFIDYQTSMITDLDPLRGLLFY